MRNGNETEGRNKYVDEWFCEGSFTTNILSLAQDAPGSQIADDWGSKIALFFQSCPGTCCWTPSGVEHRVLGLTQVWWPRALSSVGLLVPPVVSPTCRLLAEVTTPGSCFISAWPWGDTSGSTVPWDHVLELTAPLRAGSTEGFLPASNKYHHFGCTLQSWWKFGVPILKHWHQHTPMDKGRHYWGILYHFCSLSHQVPTGRMDTINIHSALTGLLKATSFFFSLQGRFIYSDYAKGLPYRSL